MDEKGEKNGEKKKELLATAGDPSFILPFSIVREI
jgi:hypothetical protein